MQSQTPPFHNSPAQENTAGLPLCGNDLVGYQEIGIEQSIEQRVQQLAAYEAVTPAQVQYQQLAAYQAVTPAPAQRLASSEDEDVFNFNVKEPNASDPFVTLKYFQTVTPPSEEKKHAPAQLGSTMTKRKRTATRDQPRVVKRRVSATTSATISDYQSVEQAAIERMRELETQNRKLLYHNDQHKLNVTALQDQVKSLQQKNVQLEHEKQQLRSYIASLPPTAELTPGSTYQSLTPSQQKALNALEVHKRILPSQPSALPSPPQELPSPSSKMSKQDVIDLKMQLASKKEETKKLRKQNGRLSAELTNVQKDTQTLFNNNEELTKTVMHFARVEQQNNTEIVGLRGRVAYLDQEVTRLNNAAHGVVEVQELQGFWPEHAHPQSASFWQQQFHDVGDVGNYGSAQIGSDSGIGDMLATPEQHLNLSDSESNLAIESIERGGKEITAEEHLERALLQMQEVDATS